MTKELKQIIINKLNELEAHGHDVLHDSDIDDIIEEAERQGVPCGRIELIEAGLQPLGLYQLGIGHGWCYWIIAYDRVDANRVFHEMTAEQKMANILPEVDEEQDDPASIDWDNVDPIYCYWADEAHKKDVRGVLKANQNVRRWWEESK